MRAIGLRVILAAVSLYGCAMTPQQAQALYMAGSALRGASAAIPDPTPGGMPINTAVRPAAGSCFKSFEQPSGMNKLCHYTCAGTEDVLLVGAADLCPLTK